jgi:hypothetical protein
MMLGQHAAMKTRNVTRLLINCSGNGAGQKDALMMIQSYNLSQKYLRPEDSSLASRKWHEEGCVKVLVLLPGFQKGRDSKAS